MKTIQLSGTNLTVSRLCFGCWGITSDFHWGDRDERQSLAAIQAALEAGVNFFDTASAYGDGASERLLGRAIKGQRDAVVIASKVHPKMMTPEKIAQDCEKSLERLGIDHLDLYQLHWATREVPMEDCWDAMLRLRQQGKTRYVGVCNLASGDLADVSRIEPPVTNQLPYSLLWRMLEDEILPVCRQHKIDVLAYSPLMHGLLSGKYRTADEVPEGRARSRHFRGDRPLARHGEPGCEPQTFQALDAIGSLCRELGRSMVDVSLAWCAQQPGIACVIAGASSAEQLRQNVAAFDSPLPQDAIGRLNQVTAELKQVLGPNPDMWDGSENSRFR